MDFGDVLINESKFGSTISESNSVSGESLLFAQLVLLAVTFS